VAALTGVFHRHRPAPDGEPDPVPALTGPREDS
jgi:hypothetical protein